MTVRTFYAAMGVALPTWADREAPVRCFAQPDAHNRGDRLPSCSVNVVSGAWNCHGCGARGRAYDAALAAGHSPRSAMDLLFAHGLAEPRPPGHKSPSEAMISARQANPPAPAPTRNTAPALAVDGGDVSLWAEMLDANSRLLRQLAVDRGWGSSVIQELEIGFDGARMTIPVRGRHGALRGVLRYDPFGRRDPKMLAVAGTRLGLIPHPAREASDRLILVEGPPDMVAARSCGLPAIAIPGTNAWRPSWAQLLTGRRVTIRHGLRRARPPRGCPDRRESASCGHPHRCRRPLARPQRRLRPHRPHPRAPANRGRSPRRPDARVPRPAPLLTTERAHSPAAPRR